MQSNGSYKPFNANFCKYVCTPDEQNVISGEAEYGNVKAILKRSGLGWIGLAWSLLMGGMVSGQTTVLSPQTSGSSSMLATYQQGQFALAREYRNLISQGATPQQLQAWQQQNATQLQAQQRMAQTLYRVFAASSVLTIPIKKRFPVTPGDRPCFRHFRYPTTPKGKCAHHSPENGI